MQRLALLFSMLFSATVVGAQENSPSRFEPLNDFADATELQSREAGEQEFMEGLRARCGFGLLRIVPDLTGLSPDEALNQLKKCDLAYLDGEPNRVFSYEAIGTVGSQEPRGGRVVRRGTEIAPLLSAGLAAPGVLGRSQAMPNSF